MASLKLVDGKDEIQEIIVAAVLIGKNDALRILDTERIQFAAQFQDLTPGLIHISLDHLDLRIDIADGRLP